MKREMGRKTGREKTRGHRGMAVVLCLVLVLGCLAFSGCNDSAAEKPEEQTDYQVSLYFINDAYILEGDEALGRFQPVVSKEIKATPETVYAETIVALANPPEQENFSTMLRDHIKVNGASLDENGKTVTVDFDSQGLSGGSMEEGLLVEQIVTTMIRSFEEVEQVKFTVDGGPIETLMGHMDISVPYGIALVDDGEGGEIEMVMPLYD